MKCNKSKISSALSDKIYQKLYKRIIAGKLKPGQRITERQIADSEGVSQAPAREALKRLAEDRLVELVPRSGCFIANPTEKDIICLCDIRKRLECLALEYAFDHFKPEQIEKLRLQFEQCLLLEPAQLICQEIKLDEQLHEFFCKSSDCDDLYLMIHKLRARVQMFRIKEASSIKRAKYALNHHIKILDAILAGDRTLAEQLLQEHIEHSCQYILMTLKRNDTVKS